MNPRDLYKAIGATIRDRRRNLSHTQEVLAQLVGISRASLANIEIGRQNLLVHQLIAIASALEIEPLDLIPISLDENVTQGDMDGIQVPRKGLNKIQRAQILDIIKRESTDTEPANRDS